MTTKKLPNRIPAEDLEAYTAWVLPPIHGKEDQVLPTAGREAKKQAEEQARRAGEKVEDVDYQGKSTGVSAEELQRIVDEAEKEGRERGYAAGFEQGRAEGYEAGEIQGEEAMRQTLVVEQQRFQHLVQSLREPIETQDEALETLLLDTVCAIAQSVVQRELLTDSSHILEQVRAAIDVLPAGANNLQIYLNPDDLALVETYAEEQQLDWKFHSDDALLPGGCRVHTLESQVDFSVEHRLAQQLEAFVNRQLDVEPGDPEDSEVLAAQAEPAAEERGPALGPQASEEPDHEH